MGIQKKVKFVGKILFYIFFVVVLLCVVGMFISKISNRVFFLGNRAAIWVMTDSMEEKIPEKSYICISKVDPSDIEVDDIITFYSDDPALKGNLNTHRVVEVKDDGKSFITRGDNNLADDKYPVKAESIVGVYEKNLTVLTAIGRAAQSKLGFVCLLILMVVLIVFSFAGDDLKKLFKRKDKSASTDEQK